MPKLDAALFLNFGSPHRLFEGQSERTGFRAWIVGLQSGFRLGEALGVREFMVVRLSPIGANLILRLPMNLIANRIMDLDDLDSRFAADLTSRGYLASTWPERLSAVEKVLAKRIADELIATGTASHGFLGARLADDTNSSGARVVEVSNGGPAAAAGLAVGAVVTTVDDQPIGNADALTAVVQSTAPGATIAVGYLDPSGRARSARVLLGTDQGQPQS